MTLRSISCFLVAITSSVMIAAAAPSQGRNASTGEEPPALSTRATSYYHYLLGSMAEAQNDFTDAVAEYTEALLSDPGNTDLRVAKARALMRANDIEAMKAELDTILQSSPDDADANEMLGVYYMSQKPDDKESRARAITALEKAAAGGSPSPRVHYMLSQIYFEENPHDVETLKKSLDALRKFNAAEPNNLDGHYRMGLVLELLKDDEPAEAEYRKVLEVAPGFTPAYRSLLGLYARLNRLGDLRALYRRVLAESPDDTRTRGGLASTLFERGLYADAAEVLEYDRLGPLYSPVLQALAARTYGRLNRPSKVIEILKGISESPDAPLDALFELGRAYEVKGDYQASSAVFESMAGKAETALRPALLFHLGFAKLELKDYAAAEKAFAEALTGSIESKDRDLEETIRRYLVSLHARSGQVDRATAEADAAMKAFPDSTEAMLLPAEILWQSGAKDASLDELRRIAGAPGASWDLRIGLARKLFDVKKYKDVAATLQSALSEEKAPEEALYLLGASYERRGKIKECRSVFEAGMKRFPENADMMNYLGYTLIERGEDVEYGVGLVNRAIATEPENEAFLDSLAWGLFKLGKLESAREQIDAAVANGEPNWEIMVHAGDIYLALKRSEEAKVFYEKALKLEPPDPGAIRKMIQKCR